MQLISTNDCNTTIYICKIVTCFIAHYHVRDEVLVLRYFLHGAASSRDQIIEGLIDSNTIEQLHALATQSHS